MVWRSDMYMCMYIVGIHNLIKRLCLRLCFILNQLKVPREINLLCGGSLLLAGNQDTDTIIAYDVDLDTGALSQRGELIPCPTPVCLLEIEVNNEVR